MKILRGCRGSIECFVIQEVLRVSVYGRAFARAGYASAVKKYICLAVQLIMKRRNV
jgi:hypothetical protein